MPLADRTNGASMDPLQASFDGAVWYVNTKTAERKPRVELAPAQKLQLYGLFKVATAGPKTPTKTARQQVNGDAWAAASHLSKQEAMAAYVELLHGTEPSWRAKAAAAGCPTLIAAASTSTEVWTPSKKAPASPAPASPASPASPAPASPPPAAPATEQDGEQEDPAIFSPARKVLFSPFSEAVRKRVRKVYTNVGHQQRPDVDSLLVKYAGQEAKLMQLIEAKYGYDGPTPRPVRDDDPAPARPPPAEPAPAEPAPAPAPAPAAPPVSAPEVPAKAAVVAKPPPPQTVATPPVAASGGISAGEIIGVALVVGGLAVVALEHTQPGLLHERSREFAEAARSAAEVARSAAAEHSAVALEQAIAAQAAAQKLALGTFADLTARATVAVRRVRESAASALER